MADYGNVAVDVAAQALTAAVPLVLAGSGELVAQRSGVMNVGIEGLMLTGCISAFAATALSGSAWLGLCAALVAAVVLAAGFAVVTIWARADQIVAGMAINLLAIGASGTAWQVLQAHGCDHLDSDHGFSRPGLPGTDLLAHIPVLGPIVFNQYGLCYATVLLVVLLQWGLQQTRAGLIVRALGDAPDACIAAGISVRGWRTLCVLFAGMCAGAAGAYLSIMRTHGFVPHMTGGSGFLVLALVIFGRWKLPALVGSSLAFGLLDGVQSQFQGYGLNSYVPYQLTQGLPYLVALGALAVMSRSAQGPAQLGRPWPDAPG